MDFNREKLKQLKRVYAIAVARNKETFMFEGHELLVAYAKYLIEYLEGRLS